MPLPNASKQHKFKHIQFFGIKKALNCKFIQNIRNWNLIFYSNFSAHTAQRRAKNPLNCQKTTQNWLDLCSFKAFLMGIRCSMNGRLISLTHFYLAITSDSSDEQQQQKIIFHSLPNAGLTYNHAVMNVNNQRHRKSKRTEYKKN